jgi:hypothetical protein
MAEYFAPDQIFQALSGACDNDLYVQLDPDRLLDVESYLYGVGEVSVRDRDGAVVARFRVRIEEIEDVAVPDA